MRMKNVFMITQYNWTRIVWWSPIRKDELVSTTVNVILYQPHMGQSLMICCDIHNGRLSEKWRNRSKRKETTTNWNIFGTNKPPPYPRDTIDVISQTFWNMFIPQIAYIFVDYQKLISIALHFTSCFYIFSVQLNIKVFPSKTKILPPLLPLRWKEDFKFWVNHNLIFYLASYVKNFKRSGCREKIVSCYFFRKHEKFPFWATSWMKTDLISKIK